MKKNKKLFAILTLVAFMMTLVPALAFAAGDTLETTVSGQSVALKLTLENELSADDNTVLNIFQDGTQLDTTMTVAAGKTTGEAAVTVDKAATEKEYTFTVKNGDVAIATATATVPADSQTATNEKIDTTTSVFGTADTHPDLIANDGTFNKDVNGAQLSLLLTDSDNNEVAGAEVDIVIWAEDVSNPGVPSTALAVYDKDGNKVTTNQEIGDSNATAKLVLVEDATVTDVANLYAAFSRGGEYNVYAALLSKVDVNAKTAKEALSNTTKFVVGDSKITVSEKSNNPKDTYRFNVSYNGKNENLSDGNYEAKNVLAVSANNVGEEEIKVKLSNHDKDTDTDKRLAGKTIAISTSSSNVSTSVTSAKTNAYGEISFKVSGAREGNYFIYLSVDGVEVRIPVSVGNTAAAYINLLNTPNAPIALYSAIDDDSQDITFSMTDINGNQVAKNVTALANDPKSGAYNLAVNETNPKAKYASFTQKPAGSTLKDADITIVALKSGDEYNGKYAVKVAKAFDKEGTYEIKLVLDNGNYVTVPFEIKEFQTPVKLILNYRQESIELGGKSTVPTIKYADVNGTTQKAANKVDLAATGYAIDEFATEKTDTLGIGQLTVKNDEKYIGQTITVTAVDSRYNLVATTSLLVADEAQAIEFNSTTAAVNANNKIGFQIVDSLGNKVAVGQNAESINVSFVVLDKPEDAKVSAILFGGTDDLRTKGQGTMALTSNKKGDVTIQIVTTVKVKNDNKSGLNTKYYTGTQTFKVGNEAGTKTQVVMSIGSHELVKNGAVSTIDAAPMIQDNRTFVPFRALAEAFGATVEFDATNNTVTAKLDGTTVVLTIGSSVMTVGDEAKTLDVAPFISGDRTMVPVRAVAEAFGFNVEATSNPDGTTADVVFTK